MVRRLLIAGRAASSLINSQGVGDLDAKLYASVKKIMLNYNSAAFRPTPPTRHLGSTPVPHGQARRSRLPALPRPFTSGKSSCLRMAEH